MNPWDAPALVTGGIPSVPMTLCPPVSTELVTNTAQRGMYLARDAYGRPLCVRATAEEAQRAGERYIERGRF